MGQSSGMITENYLLFNDFEEDHISLDEVIDQIHSSNLDLNSINMKPSIDIIIEGLSSTTKSLDSTKALLELYKDNPGKKIQSIIISRLSMAEKSPILEDLLNEVLNDVTENSLSRRFNENDKKDILELLDAEIEDRPKILLSQINKMKNQTNSKDNKETPYLNSIILSILLHEKESDSKQSSKNKTDAYFFDDPKALRKNERPEELNDDEFLDILDGHLKSNSNDSDFLDELKRQMMIDADLGRKIGKLMHDQPNYCVAMTKSLISMLNHDSLDPSIIRNILSYSNQVGVYTAIKFMSDNQKEKYLPYLTGNNYNAQLMFDGDDLLNRIDSGENFTLNALAKEGPITVPILWNIRFGDI